MSLGVVLTAFIAVGTTVGYAQDPCADADGQGALYEKFTINLKGDIDARKVAVEAGKQYLEKYGACEASKDINDYLTKNLPLIEEKIKKDAGVAALRAQFARYDAGVKDQKFDDAYAAGREILAVQPDNLDIIVPLGAIGLTESFKKNYKYNEDALRYAKMAIEKINSGKTSTKYGVYQYQYDTKEKALGAMNYAIGYITYWAKGDKKGALPYYYEASKIGATKDEPRVYATIGSYFGSEVIRLTGVVAELLKKQKALATDDEKIKMEPEIKAAIALLNGYAERAMDGFVRAYKIAKSDTPADKAYRDGLYKDLTVLYKGRFEKVDGLDGYIATVVAKPMPDPSSEVTPVADPEPATTTTTTTTTTATPASVKPATTTQTKPAAVVTTTKVSAKDSGAVVKPSETTTAVKAKPVAKKPVPRKKGKG